jgi:hypothetical protein
VGRSRILEIIAKIATTIATLVGAIGVSFAVNSYSQSVRLKRAEWLQKLYQQFYELDRYRTVREILDYRPERELAEIYAHLSDQSKDDLVDQLWKYLNFLEFVAGLVELKQIRMANLELLFEYPLQRIADDEQIMARLSQEGYEHLHVLLRGPSFSRHLS